MDASLELLHSLARSSDKRAFVGYLEFCSESKIFCFDKKKREEVCSFINSLLTSKDNINEGLIILEHFLHQCPKEILSVNILSWMQHAIKSLVNTEDASFNLVACNVIGLLIQHSSGFPEARKQIALSTIPKLLDHFIKEGKDAKEVMFNIFEGLEKILNIYGKSCGYHKTAIANLIFTQLESSPSVVFVAGQCYLNLAACGPPGANSENYGVLWSNQQKFLLNSLHGLLDNLFENITEVQDDHRVYKLEDSHPVIPKIIEKSLTRKKQRLTKQFQSLAQFIKILLLGSFPVRKKILPESMLSLVWRGLAVNHSTLSKGRHSIDSSSLVTVISQINIASLEILEALILSCRMNLISYSPLICKILSQTLKWTEVEDWPYGISRPQCLLRLETYKCFSTWLSVSRACSGVEKYLDDIVPLIISDIHHEPPTITLKVPVGKGKKNMDKSVETVKPIIDFVIDPEMNSLTCEGALKFVSMLLISASTLIKPAHHKLLQEKVVGALIRIQQCKTPLPYSKKDCRLELYKALHSLCHNSHHSYPPPINYATGIFSQGIKDPLVEVSQFCLLASRTIHNIIRPICPTLDFPPSNEGGEKLNVTTSEEVSYLLNEDSNRKIRLKRKRDQQITSTPVNKSHEQRAFIPLHEVAAMNETSGLINLSTFLEGADDSSSAKENGASAVELENTVYRVSKSNGTRAREDNIKEPEEVEEAMEKRLRIEEIDDNLLTTNNSHSNGTKSSPVENGISSTVNVEERVPSTHSEINMFNTKEKPLEEDNQNITNHSDVDKTPENKDDETHGSDDEMMNSFVDEVIEVD